MANLTDPVKTENTRYIVSSATPDVYTDIYNNVSITALAENITSMTSGLTGVPVDFQSLVIRIKDNGTARSITWGSKFVNRGGTLPTTTVVNKITTVYLEYNIATLTWGCMDVAIESLEGVTLARLDDVDITSPANGEQLVYNSTTGLWENGTPAGGGDMLASVYDTGTTGVVDTAKDVSGSPLTTTTSVASSGGLLINIDSATGDIARTTDGFIEDEKYGVYFDSNISATSAEFDSNITRTGRLTLKLSATNATGRAFATLGLGTSPGASISVANIYKYCFPMKASTKYKLSCWVKTENTLASSTYFALDTYNTSGTRQASSSSSFMPVGTNDWTLLSVNITSGASVAFGNVSFIGQIVAGNICDAWFDVNSMTLEEVIEPVANSLTSSSPSLVSFTAVGSTDNIDISQTTGAQTWAINNTAVYTAQSFTPTKSKLSGIVFRRKANSGTFTGDITVAITSDNVGVPGSTIYASYTIPNATWNAITVDTDYTVNLPCNLTPSTRYWIQFFSSTSSATDFAIITYSNTNPLATEGIAYGTDGVAYTNSTNDLYFKTLYYKPTTNFKASQNNSTVSISSDEDGLLDGSVINLSAGTATFTESFGTYYILNYTISGSDLIAEINIPGDSISGVFTSDKSLTYSSDGVTYVSTFPVGVKKIWVKILAYSGITSFSYSIKFDNSLPVLRNYPTNKDIVNVFTKSLSSATTTAIYRATKFGFPAIEYTNGDYQFLNIDTTATGSTVAFSADGTSYTTVADGDSIALTSTVNPTVYVKTNITANRIYLSSNDYNASSDKDGSNKMTAVYNVTSQGLRYSVDELHNEVNELKAAIPSTTTKLVTITGDILEKADAYTIIPTANTTIDLISIPAAGKRFSIIVRTSGTSLYTLTFGTGFKSTGTLDTGTIDSKYFTVNFISDGAQGIETSRTTAM